MRPIEGYAIRENHDGATFYERNLDGVTFDTETDALRDFYRRCSFYANTKPLGHDFHNVMRPDGRAL